MSVYLKALELLNGGRNWCKGSQKSVDGQMCLLGVFGYGLDIGYGWGCGASGKEEVFVPIIECIKNTPQFNNPLCRRDDFNECSQTPWNTYDATTRPGSLIAGFNNDDSVTFEDIEKVLRCAHERTMVQV